MQSLASAEIVHIGQIMCKPNQRLARMRESFEKDRSVLADDYAYFTTPHESIRPNKAARKSAEQSERRSREQSETPSSDRTDD
jgi:hypothetical protein